MGPANIISAQRAHHLELVCLRGGGGSVHSISLALSLYVCVNVFMCV
jgi:hypothetical protein